MLLYVLAHAVHGLYESLGFFLQVARKGFVDPFTHRVIDTQSLALFPYPKMIGIRRSILLGVRTANVICHLQQMKMSLTPFVLGENAVRFPVNGMVELHVSLYTSVEVQPYIRTSYGC
jgi:hypothetical protein